MSIQTSKLTVKDLEQFSAIIFDFDGVIAESVEIKTEAFRDMYAPYGKEVSDKVVDHHLKNGGMSRFEKIPFYHRSFLGKDLSKSQIVDLGKHLAMQVAASSPLSIDKDDLDGNTLKKEKEIITEELKNSGKELKIIEKIAIGKLNKFIVDNTLLNQEWIMEPKKKVKDVIKEVSGKDSIEIKKFIRFKVGEGI